MRAGESAWVLLVAPSAVAGPISGRVLDPRSAKAARPARRARDLASLTRLSEPGRRVISMRLCASYGPGFGAGGRPIKSGHARVPITSDAIAVAGRA